jgi:hypothetical protein
MSTFGPSPAQPVPPSQEQAHRVGAAGERKKKQPKEEAKKPKAEDSVEISGAHDEPGANPAPAPKKEGGERGHLDLQG